MAKPESFKISSALKNLIGKDLITDEFVAVYELVKNSFDAYAKTVEIIFDTDIKNNEPQIIIRDDGKGMNDNDLQKKWLFVAYSAKKLGSENIDYREKIKVNRVFAGAKGVGRFSCDRLGSKLNLITIKNEATPKIENLVVDWDQFELDPLKEFYQISVTHSILSNAPYNLKHGTVLEISGLRDIWDRNRILKLKRALVKLINPNQENDSRNFSIRIIAKNELAEDNKVQEDYQKVNGIIANTLFEQLRIKTTNISVEISKDGSKIISNLEDRGDFIYKLVEKNPFINEDNKAPILQDIKVYLFQLNQSAKNSFHKIMGMRSIDYGAVFMYKNGFRIYPFGEPGEDILLIDRRKGQGYNRFLGNRDLIGRIEISGENPELHETTSRDGGLVKTEAFHKLSTFFIDYVLKRLEFYVVNIIKWGEVPDQITGEMKPGLWAKDVKFEILELVSGFINSANVIDIQYNKDFLNVIEKKADSSIDKAIQKISKVARSSKNPQLLKEAQKISKVFREIKEDSKKAELKAEKAEEVLKYSIGQNVFLQDAVKADTKEFQSLLHHTEKATYFIEKHIANLINGIEKNSPKEKLFEVITQISLENQKIYSFTKYHKSTKFNTFVDRINHDLVSFVNEYINNVCKAYEDYEAININITTPAKQIFKMDFTPVEIPIIIDNLLNNSKKANANKVFFEWESITDKQIKLHVKDNGDGINKSVIDRIFDFHFTTTRGGSGLGLFHIKEVLSRLNGSIIANGNLAKGAEFIITFNK